MGLIIGAQQIFLDGGVDRKQMAWERTPCQEGKGPEEEERRAREEASEGGWQNSQEYQEHGPLLADLHLSLLNKILQMP